MALSSRLAIIAGGIGGLGSATARVLRSQGAKLALLYAPFEASKVGSTLNTVFGRSNGAAETADINAYECDIASPTSVQHAFDAIKTDGSAFPSILVNAAGYVNLAPLDKHAPDDVLRHYHVNLFGPTLTGQAFARAYIAASERFRQENPGNDPPGGRIVNIASQAAHVALDKHGAYCASKAGLVGLTRCMASEWGSLGITANTISPGPVWTELGRKAWSDQRTREDYQRAVPTGRFGEPEEVSRIVSFLCQDQALNINGADFRVDGGYTAR